MSGRSEELDEGTQQAVIDCLKANNPSYKGHWDEFFSGNGDFTWEFKKNKFVTYTFEGFEGVIGETSNEEASTTGNTEDESAVEEPVVEEDNTSNKNNGNNKNKNKNK